METTIMHSAIEMVCFKFTAARMPLSAATATRFLTSYEFKDQSDAGRKRVLCTATLLMCGMNLCSILTFDIPILTGAYVDPNLREN